MTPSLSVRRKADRETVARLLGELAQRRGLAFERHTLPALSGQSILRMKLTGPEGLSVTLSLDPTSAQPDVVVLSWHFTGPTTVELNADVLGRNVNPYHRQKATSAVPLEAVPMEIEEVFGHASDGSAFLPRRPAA